MSDYKLVPVEPTPEMVEAAREHHEGEAYLPVRLYKAMLAAAPAVQGEPVAWVTADTVDGQTVNGKPRRIWWENNEGVGLPIYTAPQPAPDVSALEEALERVLFCNEESVHQSVSDALAAHRKQQEVSDGRF